MEAKKNPKLDSRKYSFLFFNIGLVLALSFVIVAFEWRFYEDTSAVSLDQENSAYVEIIEEVPLTEQAPPEPKKSADPVIIELPDEEEIEEEVAFDLDIDMVEETEVEALVFNDAPQEEEAESVFSIVEEMPSFPGGNTRFYNWVAENLKYPVKAKKAKVEGRVILRFVVTKEGAVSDVEVVKGIGFGCDEEAMRVVQQSPMWNPGKQRGKSVNVRVTVPLMFDIS